MGKHLSLDGDIEPELHDCEVEVAVLFVDDEGLDEGGQFGGAELACVLVVVRKLLQKGSRALEDPDVQQRGELVRVDHQLGCLLSQLAFRQVLQVHVGGREKVAHLAQTDIRLFHCQQQDLDKALAAIGLQFLQLDSLHGRCDYFGVELERPVVQNPLSELGPLDDVRLDKQIPQRVLCCDCASLFCDGRNLHDPLEQAFLVKHAYVLQVSRHTHSRKAQELGLHLLRVLEAVEDRAALCLRDYLLRGGRVDKDCFLNPILGAAFWRDPTLVLSLSLIHI